MGDDKKESILLKESKARKQAAFDQRILDGIEMDKKIEVRALARRLYAESTQANFAKGFTKAQEALAWRKREVMQEVSLAQQILSDRIEVEREANRRCLLRNSQELQEFSGKLRAAYNQKELFTQLETKRAEKIRNDLEKREENYRLRTLNEAANKIDEQRAMEKHRKKVELRNYLQDQMIENEKRKIESYKDSLEDKAIMSDAVDDSRDKNLENEDRKNRIKLLEAEREEAAKYKEYWKEKEKEIQEEEERDIEKYLENRFKKEKELQDRFRREYEIKLKNQDITLAAFKKNLTSKEEEERVNEILLNEDTRLRLEAKIKEEEDKKLQMRQELRDVFTAQVEDKLKRLEQERLVDLEFSKIMKQQINENAEYEKKCVKDLKLNRLKYAQELKAVIADRESLRQRDLYRNIMEYKISVKENLDRVKEIDEERLLMLKEHSSRLLGFLPKGTVREADLQQLPAEVQCYYNYTPQK